VKNTTNNVQLARIGLAPKPAPDFRAHPQSSRGIIHRGAVPNVARVYRPEALAPPSSRFESRTKGLTSKEVSYICPTPSGSLACPEDAAAGEGVTVFVFLTGTPKQLEIAATRSKQTTEVIPNRDKNTTPPSAIRRSTCSAGPGFVRHGFPSTMPHEDRYGGAIPGQISRHTSREITPLTHTKQTIGVPISRHKIGTPSIPNFGLVLTYDLTSNPTGAFAHV
jgi:hypothetical protein